MELKKLYYFSVVIHRKPIAAPGDRGNTRFESRQQQRRSVENMGEKLDNFCYYIEGLFLVSFLCCVIYLITSSPNQSSVNQNQGSYLFSYFLCLYIDIGLDPGSTLIITSRI